MPMTDRLSSYRSLRNWTGAGEDSQAATITADATAYKVSYFNSIHLFLYKVVT